MRYDLRRPGVVRRGRDGARVVDLGPAPTDYDPYEGGPRRVIVSAGVAALIIGGTIGSYFGVVNGLGALLERPPAPGALPAVANDSDVTALRPPGVATAPRQGPGQPAAGPAPTATTAATASVGRRVGRATAPLGMPEAGVPELPGLTPAPECPCEEPPDDPAPPYGPTTPVEPTTDPSLPAEPTPTPTPTPTPEASHTEEAGYGSGGGEPHAR
jgi:hypothetical protein